MTSFFSALIMALKLTQYKILFCNDDDNVNVNGNDKEKTIGLDRQNNNSARASRFFVHFLTVTARLKRQNA